METCLNTCQSCKVQVAPDDNYCQDCGGSLSLPDNPVAVSYKLDSPLLQRRAAVNDQRPGSAYKKPGIAGTISILSLALLSAALVLWHTNSRDHAPGNAPARHGNREMPGDTQSTEKPISPPTKMDAAHLDEKPALNPAKITTPSQSKTLQQAKVLPQPISKHVQHAAAKPAQKPAPAEKVSAKHIEESLPPDNSRDADVAAYNKLLADYFIRPGKQPASGKAGLPGRTEPPTFKEWLAAGRPDF